MRIECNNPEAVAKRAFFLAYEACGGARGMGLLQAVQGAAEDDVWRNVRSAGDYGAGAEKLMRASEPGRAYGDYVFGRMMKLSIEFDGQAVTVRDDVPRSDYQSWCRKYRTYAELVRAAIESLQQQVKQ